MTTDNRRSKAHSLHERLKRIKSRVLIHRWELRQRRYAKGTWFRLRRVLCRAEEAYAIPAQAAQGLESRGLSPIPVGFELDPPIRMYGITREALETIADRKRLRLRLDHALLQARSIALVPFPGSRESRVES